MLEEIMKAIREAKNVDTLIFLLKDLCDEARKIIERNTFSVHEARDLTSCLREIRMSLWELELINKQRNCDRRVRSLEFIEQCFSDLESRTEAIIKHFQGKRK